MNNRERFLRIMGFKAVDRVPDYEIGIWPQTAERWKKEGMPPGVIGEIDIEKSDEIFSEECLFFDKEVPFFGFEHIEFTRINTYIPEPEFEEVVIEEDERKIVYRDVTGVTHLAMKEGTVGGLRPSMDKYIDFPVKDRSSYLELKKRYTADEKRYPSDWKEKCFEWKTRKDPLCLFYIGEFGYYSLLRRWMGTEGASYIFYDDPDLVEEMFEFMTDYVIELMEKALKDSDYDCFHIFEDMAFNSGPLVSPELVRKFMLPQYKRLTDHLRKHGITNVFLDCDGAIDKLIPIWIEAGINCLVPCESNAGSDPVSIRKKYGTDIALMGGIGKYELTKTKKDIEYEVKRKCEFMFDKGGYIPTLDHTAPPDIPYENFLYYLEIKRKCLKGDF